GPEQRLDQTLGVPVRPRAAPRPGGVDEPAGEILTVAAPDRVPANHGTSAFVLRAGGRLTREEHAQPRLTTALGDGVRVVAAGHRRGRDRMSEQVFEDLPAPGPFLTHVLPAPRAEP